MLLTNISTEHLIGMNGSSYKNGFIIIAWEVTSALALVIAAIVFIPKYLKLGLSTIPEYLEKRFDGITRSLVALFLVVSFVVTLLPIVLYTGAINLESIFNVSEVLDISRSEGLWLTVVCIGVIGSVYAIFGGLKAVAYSDTINGVGLLIGGILVPVIALVSIGNGNLLDGLSKVFHNAPEKFNVIGAKDSVMPFSVLFTGLIINQLYFWGMNQTIIQRALGAKNLKEAQKGLLFTGVLKILVPIIIVLPGVIGFYYFGDSMYANQDLIYPALIKKVLPVYLTGFFAAVVMGAVLSTFNSVLNSAATIFSIDVYKRMIDKDASEKRMVWVGRSLSSVLAVAAILSAPLVAKAPEGLYQLLQQLNGIFFIPIASIMLAGFFMEKVSAVGAKSALIFGLIYYIVTTFVLKINIHFIHNWGIEFVLNVIIMYTVSYFYPRKNFSIRTAPLKVEMVPWKYTPHLSAVLVVVTIMIYILLGQT
jgi:SSS family solute:Na+ symporter